jgi:CheY-like chemotaxis protein
MALAALVVCADKEAVDVLRRVLEDRGIGVEHCRDAAVAVARLAELRYGMVLVDCSNEPGAIEVIAAARNAPANPTTLVVAIVDAGDETHPLFAHGANFLLYKPVSEERAAESLQAAWSLIPKERRRKRRAHVATQALITYATTEDAPAPLLNLSEDGVTLHSNKKVPVPGRVYFQFKLPGQHATVRLSGDVVWQDSRGHAGVHFAHVPQASRRALDVWLKTNLPEPGLGKDVPAKTEEPPAAEEHYTASLGTHRTSSAERRKQARRSCRLGVNVYAATGGLLQHCKITDISAGGCYVETTQPLPAGSHLVIEVRTDTLKLRLRGRVQSMHRGYGMGIEFSRKTPEERELVKQLIACRDAQIEAETEASAGRG